MNIEKEINKIKKRNKKVESDKAWETSLFRKIVIFLLTYIVIVVFFLYANIEKPFLNAIVPALAFLLSTLSLQVFKKIWLRSKGS
jgi:hypothetical protein